MQKKFSIYSGIALIVIGILGLLPNPFFGKDKLVEVDLTHNIFHAIIGGIIILMALGGEAQALRALKIFGWFFVLLAVTGFLMPDKGYLFGFLSSNIPGHWLHMVLGVILLALAVINKKEEPEDINISPVAKN
ncbi:MAG: DUF4383 domain-containing protein [Candidatus Doudnabacteria bacterium]|nr:DUF4383 domain-containing protein [Candidatus Doudnabacteria bacterium]